MTNERHGPRDEVPQDGPERFEPLDTQYHVVDAKCQAVASDLEWFVANPQESLSMQPEQCSRSPFATATWRPVRGWRVMPARTAASESTKLCVDRERDVVHLHIDLHSLGRLWVDARERGDRDLWFFISSQHHLFLITQHLNYKQLLALTFVAGGELVITVEAKPFGAAVGDFCG